VQPKVAADLAGRIHRGEVGVRQVAEEIREWTQ
jgi:hypothetical protein